MLGSMRPLLQIWRGTALRRNSIGSTQFNFLQEQRKRGSHRLRAAPVRLRNSEGWESMDGGGLRRGLATFTTHHARQLALHTIVKTPLGSGAVTCVELQSSE